jgi:hypothetical protein
MIRQYGNNPILDLSVLGVCHNQIDAPLGRDGHFYDFGRWAKVLLALAILGFLGLESPIDILSLKRR